LTCANSWNEHGGQRLDAEVLAADGALGERRLAVDVHLPSDPVVQFLHGEGVEPPDGRGVRHEHGIDQDHLAGGIGRIRLG
jgi:hypothetical protein